MPDLQRYSLNICLHKNVEDIVFFLDIYKCIFDIRYFPKGFFPSGTFPNVQFPKFVLATALGLF